MCVIQDEYASLKAQESRTAKKMSEIGADNKTLLKKLDEAKPDVEVLRHKLQHYEKVEGFFIFRCIDFLFRIPIQCVSTFLGYI